VHTSNRYYCQRTTNSICGPCDEWHTTAHPRIKHPLPVPVADVTATTPAATATATTTATAVTTTTTPTVVATPATSGATPAATNPST
jgi:hypothetical protein